MNEINTNVEGYYYTYKETAIGPMSSEQICIIHANKNLPSGTLVMIMHGTPTIAKKTVDLTNLHFIKMYFIQDPITTEENK